MRNLLNCHVKGLHSFPISFENGLYRRIFYADTDHKLYSRVEDIAIHPHHCDIKITVLDGYLQNLVWELTEDDEPTGYQFNSYKWNSHINTGNGGFEYLGRQYLKFSHIDHLMPDSKHLINSVTLKSCELHTVYLQKGNKCVWLIEEEIPSCEYFPINYSRRDLATWTPDGLYIEVGDDIKEKYIREYLHLIK